MNIHDESWDFHLFIENVHLFNIHGEYLFIGIKTILLGFCMGVSTIGGAQNGWFSWLWFNGLKPACRAPVYPSDKGW